VAQSDAIQRGREVEEGEHLIECLAVLGRQAGGRAQRSVVLGDFCDDGHRFDRFGPRADHRDRRWKPPSSKRGRNAPPTGRSSFHQHSTLAILLRQVQLAYRDALNYVSRSAFEHGKMSNDE
jgi:hypothetical protein